MVSLWESCGVVYIVKLIVLLVFKKRTILHKWLDANAVLEAPILAPF